MKKSLFIMLLTLAAHFFCIGKAAAESLVLKLKTNEEVIFELAGSPKVNYEGTILKIKGNGKEFSTELSNVVNYTFTGNSADINPTTTQSGYAVENDVVKLANLKANEVVLVTSIDGKIIHRTKADSTGSSIIELKDFSKGIYIFKTNNLSFKLSIGR